MAFLALLSAGGWSGGAVVRKGVSPAASSYGAAGSESIVELCSRRVSV